MQNLNSLFMERGFFWDEGKELLESYAERNFVRLRMSRKYPHLGILHYKDDIIFGRGDWTPFARACRGVIVDFKNRKIKTFPFRKFFNLGESHAISIREAEKKKNLVVEEKLDGSMIETFFDDVTKTFIASTKGDIDSEQGAWATPRIPESVKDKELLNKYTLIWEMISKEHQIVIPYDKKGYEEGLYLIGIRENISEKLLTPVEVHIFAKQYGLKTFKTYSFGSIQDILDNAKALSFMDEGYVLRFADEEELLLKVKSSEYLRVHRFISTLSDKNLLDVLIAGQEQQIFENLGMVPEEYRDDVTTTLERYQKEAFVFRNKCYTLFAAAPKDDRKTFALYVTKLPSEYNEYKKFLFWLLDGEDISLPKIYQVFRARK